MTPLHWRVVEADEDATQGLVHDLALPLAVARVLVARGYDSSKAAESFLTKSMKDLAHPLEMMGMRAAANRIFKAIKSQERILVHGDFDADGITSTALLSLFLEDVGANIISFIPNRLIEGHGISHRAIEQAKNGGVKLVITCDCGSSSEEEIQELSKLGIETIVTDHHHVDENFQAQAILVNPKAHQEPHDHEGLSGVGVAFMLVIAIRSCLREAGYFSQRPEPNLKAYLDIVALGTIADVAPLVGQNRILVAKGLEELSRTSRPGIQALKEITGLASNTWLQSEDVGFRLAPRINAAARLGHADDALALLLAKDEASAVRLARRLEDWNVERKQILEQMMRLAEMDAEAQVREGKATIVVASEHYHPGIIGLAAQKLCEKFGRPSFVFSLGTDLARGSARSRGGVNLVEALQACRHLLISFGGHMEAGGCTLNPKQLPEFQVCFEKAVCVLGVAAMREVVIDAEANLGHLNIGFLSSFNRLRPFGVGNPEPLFLSAARVLGPPKEMGKNHVRAVLRGSEGPAYAAIGFGMWKKLGSLLRGDVEVVYAVDENEWKGRRELRLLLKGARPTQA